MSASMRSNASSEKAQAHQCQQRLHACSRVPTRRHEFVNLTRAAALPIDVKQQAVPIRCRLRRAAVRKRRPPRPCRPPHAR
jgi:hypothetical protein